MDGWRKVAFDVCLKRITFTQSVKTSRLKTATAATKLLWDGAYIMLNEYLNAFVLNVFGVHRCGRYTNGLVKCINVLLMWLVSLLCIIEDAMLTQFVCLWNVFIENVWIRESVRWQYDTMNKRREWNVFEYGKRSGIKK